ncbi:hypothetical protein AB4396_00220 [Vibrio cyclitrophicus]|uniref:hypothetical protein n=1 Tax=Vibrio sp. R78045 TaxID=3093868 RepID=UPI00354C355B
MLNVNEWMCEKGDEEDYVVERFEIRIKGKKPLVLNAPTFTEIVFVTQQYLNLPLPLTKQVVIKSVLDSVELLTLKEHCALVNYLEASTGSL